MTDTKINKVFSLEIKSLGEDGSFEGYGSVFGNVDAYNDVVVKGAFSNFLSNNNAKSVKLLWQHDASQPIGYYEKIYEDEKGLFVAGKLLVNDIPKAKEAYALLKSGAIDGLSIGFSINSEGASIGQDGVRYLKDLKLWEVSVVTFPANRAANVESVKNIDVTQIKDIRDFEKALRDLGFSRQRAVELASCGWKPCPSDSDMADEKSTNAELIKGVREILTTLRNGAN